MPGERQFINVAHIEDVTAVVRPRSSAVGRIEGVIQRLEITGTRCTVKKVRVGVCNLGGKSPFVLKPYTGLQGIVMSVGLVFFLVDVCETGILTQFVGDDLTVLDSITVRVSGVPTWICGRIECPVRCGVGG